MREDIKWDRFGRKFTGSIWGMKERERNCSVLYAVVGHVVGY
jgi:hypothetical protein